MALIYITGPSGSGKSTVRDKLKDLGYEAHDTDESINTWFNKKTGEPVVYNDESAKHPTEWVAENIFLMSEEKIKALAAEAKHKDIFICGLAPNDVDVMHYFDKVICLLISAETMKQRVVARENNKWGKHPEQVAIMMKWYQPTVDRCRNLGATMIDATLPIDEVVDQVLVSSLTNGSE